MMRCDAGLSCALRLGARVVLAALVACQERSDGPVGPEPIPPQAQIVDGAHGGGGAGLHFLRPVVDRQPRIEDPLNAALLPHLSVEICALTNGACGALLHTFTADGEGAEQLRAADGEVGHFHVDWHTRRTGVNASGYFRVTVKAAGQALGYADAYVGSGPELSRIDRSQFVPVPLGSTLPINFHINDGVQVLGAAGGTIAFLEGAVTLAAGEGMLEESVALTVEPLTEVPEHAGGFVVAGTAYDFGPDGLVFDPPGPPAQLTIAYEEANLPPGAEEDELRLLHYVNGSWETVPGSVVDTDANTVSGPVTSFSPYAAGGSTPTQLAFLVQPSDAIAGQNISPALEVEILDATGARVTTATDAVTLAVTTGTGPTGGTLLGTTTVNAVNGVATFSTVRIEKANISLPYRLSASATGLTAATSDEFKIFPAAAAKVFFDAPPAHGVIGLPLAGRADRPIINVQVVDVFENEVTTSHAITVSIGSNPGSGTLSGATTQNGSSVVFTDLAIDKAGSGYTLVANSGTLPSATSVPFNVTTTFAATGTPTVDGNSASPGVTEWDAASCTLVALTISALTATPKICFMNNATNLYFLAETFALYAPTRALSVEFDANGSGAIDSGDDLIYVASSTSPAFFDGFLFQAGCFGPICCLDILCQAPDTDAASQTSGIGVHGDANGLVNIEMSHPLSSGEAVDINVAPGQQIRARITFTFVDASDNRVHGVIPTAGLVQLSIK